MEIEKFKNPSMFWLPTRTCWRNLAIFFNSFIYGFIPEIWLFLEPVFRNKSHCPPAGKKTQKKKKKNCTK
jgi:hypothetical protein